MKKYWFIIPIIILLVVVYYFAAAKKAEYAEMKDEPHLLGNPSSSVVLVEYSDFQCPACGLATSLVKEVVEKYQDKIKFEYRHFPLTTIHKYAFRAAEAAECAADQSKFWEYHDKLFLNQDNLTKSDLLLYAKEINGLDGELFGDCLESGVKKKRVNEDLEEANRLGLNSTPTFFLNGQKVDDWQRLMEMVQGLVEPLVPLQNATSTSSSFNVQFSS